jgi:hypothetical protein
MIVVLDTAAAALALALADDDDAELEPPRQQQQLKCHKHHDNVTRKEESSDTVAGNYYTQAKQRARHWHAP